ncbi:uncharacterized protein LOC115664191 isoform X1 [Syzygium oleosum]|uniref:uncharacterized protein LOC115664191 isoform X1 n=2 Tax=Syzygium oleosum TaxID=219896 RepID=UPI0024B9A668|nr:uncharacterized protein LOC115664191 isoform X1 [Syzygium oleosum]
MDGNNSPLPLLPLFSPLAGGFRPLGARNQWFSGSLSRVSSSGSPEFGEVRSRFAMASSGDGENGENRRTRLDRDEPGDLSSIDASSVESGPSSRVSRGAAEEIGMAERLTDVFIGGGDGDLLMQRSDREDRVLQWLQVLDMQVVGACRADERFKPLLKSSESSSAAADRLLAHLSQHFEPAEVGILAICFCMPLVSIRVGKIDKQGTLLCPTSTRRSCCQSSLQAASLKYSR